MNAIELLRAYPATARFEDGLRANGLIGSGEAARMLAKYAKARTALARIVAEASAKAFGLQCAAAETEMSAEQAEYDVRTCAEYLQPLVAK